MKKPLTKAELNNIFQEHYERLDLEELQEQGEEYLENNAHLQAIKWDTRFWFIAKIVIVLAILTTASLYGYVLYKTYLAANEYEANQKAFINKTLGEPNE
jgi:hypothetical protein